MNKEGWGEEQVGGVGEVQVVESSEEEQSYPEGDVETGGAGGGQEPCGGRWGCWRRAELQQTCTWTTENPPQNVLPSSHQNRRGPPT